MVEFRTQRGLRQGDFIAPFLFLMVAEGLSGLMRQTSLCNLFLGYNIGAQQLEVSLLQFVDDIIIFARDSIHDVMCIKAILICFEIVFVLKVNFIKSRLPAFDVEDLALRRYVRVCVKL